jgi:Bacteriophage terminase large (ATPase) subunit and inactivated derivatives
VDVDALDYMAARNDMIQALLAEARSYKITQYFHDCLPGCDPESLDPKDHVSLSPEQGPTCRILYRKACRFLSAGSQYPERGFIAANRIGKTETAAFEVRCHLTGRYPDWWEGRRWSRPTDWRAAGDTMLTTRDILQTALLGPHEGVPVQHWNGMVEGKYVQAVTRKSGGIPNCIDTFYVEHVSGGTSRLSFLSYDMGRRVFQGFDCDGFWIDEEPPDPAEKSETQAQGSSDIYGECLLRTMTRDGAVLATFTPLRGWTPFMRAYFGAAMMPGTEDQDVDVPAKSLVIGSPEAQAAMAADAEDGEFAVAADKIEAKAEENPYGASVRPRFIVGATWDDAPHLTEKVKAQQWASMLPYQRAARTKGIPQLGAGAIYPIDEDEIRIPDFAIPDHWWRGFGMDAGGGAKPTAAVFAALNPEDRVVYLTSVYKRASNEPSLHAAAIKERMTRPTGWLWPGVGDASALILTQHDAQQLVHVYRRLGLDLYLPDKAVETGIADLWDLMVTGRFRVFASCLAWFEEFRMYRRDPRGRVVKSNDHLMDATRYLARTGLARMKRKPPKDPGRSNVIEFDQGQVGLNWMGG